MDAEEMIERASRDSGLPVRGDSFPDGLERFLADFRSSKTVTATGRAVVERFILDGLAARFGIEDWIARHPAVLDRPVERPVFVMGLPRAGTTLLINLLALDPQRRFYWNWEANREVPPVEAAHLHDDPRIARKVAEVEAGLASGAIDHRFHAEMGDEPTECGYVLGQDFKSYLWVVMTAVPNYVEWLYGQADMVAAYRHHKRALQVMQSRAPGKWTLKFPSHAPFVDSLLQVYPDARVVLSHRDPIRPLASSCSTSHHMTRQLNAGLDVAHVGRETTRILAASLAGMMGLRERHPGVPVHDMHYLDVAADPIGEIRRLYDFLGDDLDETTEARMRSALAAQNLRRQEIGPHRYSLAEYGLARATLPALFTDYTEHFRITREGEGRA